MSAGADHKNLCLDSAAGNHQFQISIENSADAFPCRGDQNVLNAMELLGRKGIPVGCRGGGCGVCRVRVLDGGSYHNERMSRGHISEADEESGLTLACKLYPESDLRLRVLGKWKNRFENGSAA